MILRGAVLSESTLTLDAPRPARPLAAVRNVASVGIDGPSAVSSHSAESAAVASPSPVPPAPAPLSLESVIAWLADRDQTTRAAIAAHLASELEQLRKNAHQEGYAAGHAQGIKEAQSRTQSSIAALQELTQAARTAFNNESAQLEQACVDIVCEAFAKIAGPQLSTREAAVGAVLQVLSRVKDDREVLIRVSAADLPVLESLQGEIARALAGRKFALIADPRVETGGCIVESQLGSLDGRLEVQLRSLCETVRATKLAHVESP